MNSPSIDEGLTAAALKKKWESSFDEERTDFNTRMRRAISWLERAEGNRATAQGELGDTDAEFIFCWIAFNSAYGGDGYTEKRAFKNYFGKILTRGADKHILDTIKRQCPDAIASFKDNEYVFPGFWTEDTRQATKPCEWEHLKLSSNHKIDQGIKYGNAQRVLDELFDRLYVLRNQLIHGGATWGSSVNRLQVENGAAIMRLLVPYFVDIMLDNPDADWGVPYYSPHRAWQHNTPRF